MFENLMKGTPVMLRYWRDLQALLYLAALPALVAWQWSYGISIPLYAVTLFLTVGVGAIHHNHAHCKLWRWRVLNRLTDFWLTLLQGHPTFVFLATHNANHHRFHHGPEDIARTYRFGGDTNHLVGYLLHPLQATVVLYPEFLHWLKQLQRTRPRLVRYCLAQYLAIAVFWGTLAVLDWQKWLWLVLIPSLHGLHWLLAVNYLQHAHADGNSNINFARNFEGLVNLLLFNVGLHTAHHFHGRAHWTELPALHARYRPDVDSRLLSGGLFSYMLKTFVLSLLVPRWQSRSLMRSECLVATNQAARGARSH